MMIITEIRSLSKKKKKYRNVFIVMHFLHPIVVHDPHSENTDLFCFDPKCFLRPSYKFYVVSTLLYKKKARFPGGRKKHNLNNVGGGFLANGFLDM